MPTIGPRMTALGDIDFISAHTRPARHTIPFSFQRNWPPTSRDTPIAERIIPVNGTRRLCRKLPMIISMDPQMLPSNAAFVQTEFNCLGVRVNWISWDIYAGGVWERNDNGMIPSRGKRATMLALTCSDYFLLSKHGRRTGFPMHPSRLFLKPGSRTDLLVCIHIVRCRNADSELCNDRNIWISAIQGNSISDGFYKVFISLTRFFIESSLSLNWTLFIFDRWMKERIYDWIWYYRRHVTRLSYLHVNETGEVLRICLHCLTVFKLFSILSF